MKPHPWLRPFYRRVLLVLFCIGWTVWEGYMDIGSFWFLMMVAITGWGIWDFFLSGNYAETAPESGSDS